MKSVNSCLCALLLVISGSAYAASPFCQNESSTETNTACIQAVAGAYASGGVPSPADAGDYAGRCYPGPGNYHVSAALLLVRSTGSENLLAMAFPEVNGSPVDYFDSGALASSIDSEAVMNSIAIQDGSWAADLTHWNDGDEPDYQQTLVLRKRGSYLVAEVLSSADYPSVGIKKGQVIGVCYFFKKVE